MRKELTQIKTEILGLYSPLILFIDSDGFIVGQITEEGGSYPLLDSEYEILRNNLIAIKRQ